VYFILKKLLISMMSDIVTPATPMHGPVGVKVDPEIPVWEAKIDLGPMKMPTFESEKPLSDSSKPGEGWWTNSEDIGKKASKPMTEHSARLVNIARIHDVPMARPGADAPDTPEAWHVLARQAFDDLTDDLKEEDAEEFFNHRERTERMWFRGMFRTERTPQFTHKKGGMFITSHVGSRFAIGFRVLYSTKSEANYEKLVDQKNLVQNDKLDIRLRLQIKNATTRRQISNILNQCGMMLNQAMTKDDKPRQAMISEWIALCDERKADLQDAPTKKKTKKKKKTGTFPNSHHGDLPIITWFSDKLDLTLQKEVVIDDAFDSKLYARFDEYADVQIPAVIHYMRLFGDKLTWSESRIEIKVPMCIWTCDDELLIVEYDRACVYAMPPSRNPEAKEAYTLDGAMFKATQCQIDETRIAIMGLHKDCSVPVLMVIERGTHRASFFAATRPCTSFTLTKDNTMLMGCADGTIARVNTIKRKYAGRCMGSADGMPVKWIVERGNRIVSHSDGGISLLDFVEGNDTRVRMMLPGNVSYAFYGNMLVLHRDDNTTIFANLFTHKVEVSKPAIPEAVDAKSYTFYSSICLRDNELIIVYNNGAVARMTKESDE
jgi:hypothetical protein